MRSEVGSAVFVALVLSACGQQVDHAATPAPVREAATPSGSATPTPTNAPPDPTEAPVVDRTEWGRVSERAVPGLAGYDPSERVTEPPPTVRALLDLPRCRDAGGLPAWAREAMEPFGGIDGDFAPAPLADVADTTPVLAKPPAPPACALAGTVGEAELWELRGADGAAVARGVASERLVAGFPRVYDRQQAMGGINFGQSAISSGQHVAGVWRGRRMELEFSELEPRRKSMLVVEWAAEPPEIDSSEQQVLAEVRAGLLTTATPDLPDYIWALPVPRALPPGYVRCFGPAPWNRMQTTITEFCDGRGGVITVGTANKGGTHPVPDPPTRTTVEQRDGAFQVSAVTPYEDLTMTFPARLGRAKVDAMLATVPMLDRRVWLPGAGRGRELVPAYSAAWVEETLRKTGAAAVVVREQPAACPAVGGGEPCRPPDPPPYEGEATTPDGRRVQFHVFAPESPMPGAVMDAHRVVTIGRTDVLVADGYAPSATAWCGGVRFSMSPQGVGTSNRTHWDGRPSVGLLVEVLRALGC